MPHGLLCRIAEHSLRSGIPRRNDAVQVFADDGIVGRLDERPKERRWIDTKRWQAHIPTGRQTAFLLPADRAVEFGLETPVIDETAVAPASS